MTERVGALRLYGLRISLRFLAATEPNPRNSARRRENRKSSHDPECFGETRTSNGFLRSVACSVNLILSKMPAVGERYPAAPYHVRPGLSLAPSTFRLL